MNRTIPLLCLLLLTGCSSLELQTGVGKNDRLPFLSKVNNDWIDHGGVGAYLGLVGKRRLTDRMDGMCYYKHFSQYNVGKPFDDRKEDTLDAYGCGVSIQLFGE